MTNSKKSKSKFKLSKPAAIALVILILASFVTAWHFSSQKMTSSIYGKVSIGPFCPVERTPPQQCGPIDIYSSRKLILQPILGISDYVQLNADGTFNATVQPGTYKADITSCTFLGCSRSLPKLINVQPNQTFYLEIDIDTGIR